MGNTCNRNVLNAKIEELLVVTGTCDATAIKKKLREIVSEYTPQMQRESGIAILK